MKPACPFFFFFNFITLLQAEGEPTFAELGRYIRDCVYCRSGGQCNFWCSFSRYASLRWRCCSLEQNVFLAAASNCFASAPDACTLAPTYPPELGRHPEDTCCTLRAFTARNCSLRECISTSMNRKA